MTPLPDDPQFFTKVFEDEASEIQERRARISGNDAAAAAGLPRNLTGLALSGGGIRSATFCLGVLQALGRLNLLKTFDYLSTVSGGGFAGGWWSGWLSRFEPGDNADQVSTENVKLFPPVERIEPQRSEKYSDQSRTGKLAESSISAGADPIHHLRLFANYLTPRRGILSTDTWRAIGLIIRNLILTWVVLLPLLLAAVLLGQAYYAWRASDDFPHERMAAVKEIGAGNQPAVASRVEQTAPSSVATVSPTPTPSNVEQLGQSFVHMPSDTRLRNEALMHRARVAAKTVALLGAFPVLFAFCWLVGIQGGPVLLRLVNSVIGYALLVILADVFFDIQQQWVVVLIGLLLLLLAFGIVTSLGSKARLVFGTITSWLTRSPQAKRNAMWERELYLTAMTRWMSRTLIFAVVGAAVLAVAGFGHEAVEYVCCYNAPSGSPLRTAIHYVSKSVSIGSVFAAIAGMIYTWNKSAPAGGGDKAEAKKTSPTSRLILAITPPLVIVVLAVALAWLAHALVSFVLLGDSVDEFGGLINLRIRALTGATRLGIYFAFFLVLLEMDLSDLSLRALHLLLFLLFVTNVVFLWMVNFDADTPFGTLVIASIAIAIVVMKFLWNKLRKTRTEKRPWLVYVAGIVFVFLAAAIIHRLVPHGTTGNKTWLFAVLAVVSGLAILNLSASRLVQWRFLRDAAGKPRIARLRLVGLLFLLGWTPIILGAMLLAEYTFKPSLNSYGDLGPMDTAFRGIIRAGVVLSVLVFLQLWKLRTNNRATWLVTSILVTLTVLLILVVGEDPLQTSTSPLKAVTLLATTALTWVMTIGWVMDPNMLSMHAFYKGRLVRAYLGASNPERKLKKKEVTDAAEGDDVLLSDLQNCRRGGPYHLINTTLNLAGGRDLVTAQRSSAMFVLSKKYCGSLRTGYRPSSEYMGGELSLGTALAVSGAAVSPNMGSMKTTASLAMLMTLLNVRLGYWAPTPNKDSWRSPQARLWPYYVLREFLSQTTDLSSYCYLTDGGHFDNTGLYSLVERGCRYLIVVDGSADPGKCFADLGNAVRRCRIDFGAKIDLDITPLLEISKEDKFPRTNHVVGSITYSQSHFHDLGWDDVPGDERTGVIVYMKPGLIERQPSLSIDVRQYAIENASFPHETTADQWFDEAQFESYRALGEQSAKFLIESLNVSQTQLYKSALRKEKAQQKLNEEEANALGAFAVRKKIDEKTLTLQDVPGLFHSLQGLKSG